MDKDWHEKFSGKLGRKLWLMRCIASYKDMIDRLERLMTERESKGIRFRYEELRMIFSDQELRLIIDYKRNRLSELQDELKQYTKTTNEANKKVEKLNNIVFGKNKEADEDADITD